MVSTLPKLSIPCLMDKEENKASNTLRPHTKRHLYFLDPCFAAVGSPHHRWLPLLKYPSWIVNINFWVCIIFRQSHRSAFRHRSHSLHCSMSLAHGSIVARCPPNVPHQPIVVHQPNRYLPAHSLYIAHQPIVAQPSIVAHPLSRHRLNLSSLVVKPTNCLS